MFKFFITYLIIGSIGFVIDLSIYTYLLKTLKLNWFYSNSISFILTTPISFFLYNKFNYKKDLTGRNIQNKLLLFVISNIAAVILLQFFMYLQIEIFGFDTIKSKLLSSILVITINFMFRSLIIWKI